MSDELGWMHALSYLGLSRNQDVLGISGFGSLDEGSNRPWVLASSDLTPGLMTRLDSQRIVNVGPTFFREIGFRLGEVGVEFDALGRPVKPKFDSFVDSELHWLREVIRAESSATSFGWIELDRWPSGHSFACWLSHDLDALSERNFFQVPRNWVQALVKSRSSDRSVYRRRAARATFRPLSVEAQFARLFSLVPPETSTFYVLVDRLLHRRGPRYRLTSSSTKRVLAVIQDRGGEFGFHVGTTYFRSRPLVSKSLKRLRDQVGPVQTTRGHYLCWDHRQSGEILSATGITTDSTSGLPNGAGFRLGTSIPVRRENHPLELPLVFMDVALWQEEDPHGRAESLLAEIRRHGGLVSVLIHNEYVNAPEHEEMVQLMELIVGNCQQGGAWFANAGSIHAWTEAKYVTRIERSGNEIKVINPPTNLGVKVWGRSPGPSGVVSEGEVEVMAGWI